MVEELSSYTPQDLADLDALMHELSTTSFCNEELLNKALNDANVHVYVIRDESDSGTGSSSRGSRLRVNEFLNLCWNREILAIIAKPQAEKLVLLCQSLRILYVIQGYSLWIA